MRLACGQGSSLRPNSRSACMPQPGKRVNKQESTGRRPRRARRDGWQFGCDDPVDTHKWDSEPPRPWTNPTTTSCISIAQINSSYLPGIGGGGRLLIGRFLIRLFEFCRTLARPKPPPLVPDPLALAKCEAPPRETTSSEIRQNVSTLWRRGKKLLSIAPSPTEHCSSSSGRDPLRFFILYNINSNNLEAKPLKTKWMALRKQ